MTLIELEDHFCGMHISAVCDIAVKQASKESRPVHFKFNDVDVTVQPGESAAMVEARWNTDREAAYIAWINSDEYKQRELDYAAEDRRKREAHMTESAKTEAEMRSATVPHPLTPAQLIEYIASLLNREHDYGTCVYAMSMAAVAAFNYAAGCLGVTGFQASCADLDVIRRTRGIKGPFILLKGEDALYPQYDLSGKLDEALHDWKQWLREEAQKKLDEPQSYPVHPDVIAHWQKLAGSENQ